jgi:hypothetical protein
VNRTIEWLRDAPWLNRRRIAVYPKLFLALFGLSFAIWVAMGRGLIDPRGKPIGPDFINFYAASAEALAGHASSAYDIAAHGDAERAAVGGRPVAVHLFDYPPTYILLILPLAMLPYVWSLLAWIALTAVGYLAVIRRIAPLPEATWLALAFPGAWMNALTGQNAFLSLILLGGALLTLERRPLLAGVLCGILTYKPHLAILVLFVLVADRRWRAAFAAIATVCLFAASAWMVFGIESWRGFFHLASVANRMILGEGANPFAVQQTLFAELRWAGIPASTAYTAQFALALLVAGVVIWIWRAAASFRVKAAALATGVLMVTPYLGYYDLALLALPVAWLGCEGLETGFMPYEKTVLAAAWIVPLAYGFLLAPWLVMLLFVLITIRARASRRLLSPAMPAPLMEGA